MKEHSKILYGIMITLPIIIYWNREIENLYTICYQFFTGHSIFDNRSILLGYIWPFIYLYTVIILFYYFFLCSSLKYKPSGLQMVFFILLGILDL